MSFVIRQVSRTADGREIVRVTTVAGHGAAVGRLSENAVHLADLAVEPRHAVIREAAAGRIEIEALSGLGFELNGRTVLRAEIDAATGAELRFGGHRLKLGAEGDAIAVTVEQIAAAETDRRGVFSLQGLIPGKRGSAYAFMGLILAAFLAWPIWTFAAHRGETIRPAGPHGDQSWSSGPLSQAHAALAQDCQACHTDAFVAVRDTACATCHSGSHQGAGSRAVAMAGPNAVTHAAADRMAAASGTAGLGSRIKGFFKAGFNIPEQRCVDCHTEHEGAGPMPATRQAFCADCHDGLGRRLRTAGFTSQAGDASDFGAKHPQFRPAILAGHDGSAPDTRGSEHSLKGWSLRRAVLDRPLRQDGGLKFAHAQHLSDRNGVAQMWRRVSPGQGPGMACADCHKPDPSGIRFQPVTMESACQGCHSLGLRTVGGIVRQLPHGEPARVIADIRTFHGSSGGLRPTGPSGGREARSRPGAANAERRSSDVARAAALMPGRGEALIRATFAPRGLCGDCHIVSFGGGDRVRIAPVAQPARYLHKGWFDHRPHRNLAVRGQDGGRIWGCKDCHAADTSNDARDLLLPALATCQSCHVGEQGEAGARLVRSGTVSSCAMCHDYHADGGAPWVPQRDRRKATVARQVAVALGR